MRQAESLKPLGFAAQAWMLKDGDCARSPQDQLMFGCTAEFRTGLGMFLQDLLSPRKEPGSIWKVGLCLPLTQIN